MSLPFSEDVAIVFTLIKSYPGIKGEHLIRETNFGQNRAIDAVKELVLHNLVYVDLSAILISKNAGSIQNEPVASRGDRTGRLTFYRGRSYPLVL